MKILAVAYACDPRFGSEPGIGWNWVKQIASRYDCWVITRENNVELVQRQAQQEGLHRLRVIGFDLPRWARFWKRGSRGALLYFYLWQLGLTRLARKLDREHDFDAVHHLTFSSSWVPSGLAAVDKPFVWGPIGRHPRVPDRFLLRADLRLRIAEMLKGLVRNLMPKVDPFTRATVRAADSILSLGQEGARNVPSEHASKIEPMLACGTSAPPLTRARLDRRGPLRVLYAGRLVDLKGIRLAVEAFSRANARAPMELHIAGEGPRANWVDARVEELRIGTRVRRHGHLSLDRTHALMASADVFLFPSFEGAGMVVVEAMALGCPIVCLDFGGPGEMVNESSGIRVPLGSFERTVNGLAQALVELDGDEPGRRKLAQGAYGWARHFGTWNFKGERLPAIYAGATDHWRAAS